MTIYDGNTTKNLVLYPPAKSNVDYERVLYGLDLSQKEMTHDHSLPLARPYILKMRQRAIPLTIFLMTPMLLCSQCPKLISIMEKPSENEVANDLIT